MDAWASQKKVGTSNCVEEEKEEEDGEFQAVGKLK